MENAVQNGDKDLQLPSLELVDYRPRYLEGYRRLVVETLAEFGFHNHEEWNNPDIYGQPQEAFDRIWVIAKGDKVTGSIAVRRDGEKVEIKRMYVAKLERGKGHGRRLMERALEWATQNGCEAAHLTSTDRMSGTFPFYDRFGFQETGVTKYEHHQDVHFEVRLD